MPLMCESCGEAEQECHLADAGMCGDCTAIAFKELTAKFFWNPPCGRPLFNKSGQMVAICTVPFGMEHDHSSIFD